MHTPALAAAAFALLFASQSPRNCAVPELILVSHPDYDDLVCRGIASMESGDYGLAIDAFERAMDMPLSEVPNYNLFSRLALAHFRAGDLDQAKEMLERARISLYVLTGIYRCEEHETGVSIVDRYGTRVISPQAQAVMRRMCGAIYNHYYERMSLESFAHDGRLVELFLEVEGVVNEP